MPRPPDPRSGGKGAVPTTRIDVVRGLPPVGSATVTGTVPPMWAPALRRVAMPSMISPSPGPAGSRPSEGDSSIAPRCGPAAIARTLTVPTVIATPLAVVTRSTAGSCLS